MTAAEDSVEVEDLASTNGTYVNDARVTRAQLTGTDLKAALKRVPGTTAGAIDAAAVAAMKR